MIRVVRHAGWVRPVALRTAVRPLCAAAKKAAEEKPPQGRPAKEDRPSTKEERIERAKKALAARIEKAEARAAARAAAELEEEERKEQEFVDERDRYFRTKKHRHLADDVRINGSRAHLKASELRALMEQADRELAVEDLPPQQFAPEFYTGVKSPNVETELCKIKQRGDNAGVNRMSLKAHRLNPDKVPPLMTEDQKVEAYDERQINKYGYALPYITKVHSSLAKKKTATGNQLRRRTLLTAGNRKGLVGWGVGKSSDHYQSWLTAYSRCLENAIFVPLAEGRTLPHPVEGRFKRTTVVVLPARRGHAITAGRSIYPILRSIGVQDAICKIHGRRNPYSVVMALFDALRKVLSRQEVANARGRKVYDVLDPGDYRIVNPDNDEVTEASDKAIIAITNALSISWEARAPVRTKADYYEDLRLAELNGDELNSELGEEGTN